jgi:hypothetical protein
LLYGIFPEFNQFFFRELRQTRGSLYYRAGVSALCLGLLITASEDILSDRFQIRVHLTDNYEGVVMVCLRSEAEKMITSSVFPRWSLEQPP